MQAFVAFLSVLLIASASGEDKKDTIVKNCVTNLKATPEVASIVTLKKEASNEGERCFLQCFYEGLGLIKDGKLSHEGSDAIAKERFADKPELVQKAHEIFESCQKTYTPTNENCALGKHIRTCFIQNDNEQMNFFSKKP